MSIYRGAGGSGDAVADSASEALLVQQLAIEAQADADAAAASASSASSSASSASSSASAAAASAATIDTTLFARKANNLSDLASASTARTNLGLTIGTDVLSPSGSGASLTSLNATNLSSGTVATARLPAFTGDATSTSGTSALTLATVNSNTGAFGSSSAVPVITVNGKGLITAVSTASVASLSWQSVQTSNFTAVAGNGYPVNTTSSAITVTFPASPSAGDILILTDYAGTWNTKNVTINPNGNKILSGTVNLLLQNQRESVSFVYIDAIQGWIPYSGFQDAIPVLTTYSASYLVVAGGGGGVSGGGGAGGYQTSTATLNAGTVYTITVGAGQPAGVNGSDSVISGSGLSTITSIGGGASAGAGSNGASGGSGGGGAASGSGTTTGGSGTSGQGSAGGGNVGFTAGPYPSGGGGGATATGANAVNSTTSGAGGTGLANPITGSTTGQLSSGVYYLAGGGGGATYITGNPAGAGGLGGGGGGGSSSNGTAGTPNTGGGGGGTYVSGTGGAGGSGVVILSVPTTRYSGTTTGSPTVTTSGSNTIITYNSSGSYTA